MLAVLGDLAPRVDRELGIRLERDENLRLLDDRVLAQQEVLLQVGAQPRSEIDEQPPRDVPAPQQCLEHERMARVDGEILENLLAGVRRDEGRGELGIQLLERRPRVARDLGALGRHQLDLERDQILRRKRQNPLRGEQLQLPALAGPDLLDQRVGRRHGRQGRTGEGIGEEAGPDGVEERAVDGCWI